MSRAVFYVGNQFRVRRVVGPAVRAQYENSNLQVEVEELMSSRASCSMGWFLGFSMDDWWALVLVPFQTLPVTFYLVYQVATLFLSVLLFIYIVCLFCVFGKIPEEVLVGGSLIAIHPTSAFSFSVRVLAPLAALVGG